MSDTDSQHATTSSTLNRGHGGNPGQVGQTPGPTTNLVGHLKRTMGITMVGRNGITESGTQNSKPISRRFTTLVPHIMYISGSGSQTHTSKIPSTSHQTRTTRETIEQYLKLEDWASLLTNKGPREGDPSWASSPEIVSCQER